MTTARQKVLAYLNKTRTASVREVSRALKMSAANVRHHLRVLVSDGRLEISSARGREGKGRPEKVYMLPRAVLGDNLSALADALLTEARALSGDEASRMEVLARRLAGESDFKNQVVSKRLNLIVEKLNQMKYHARWEAGSGGPRILFGHCPYAAIIAKRPELCRMDAALLKEFFGEEFEQIAKIENFQGVCVFIK